MKVWYYLVHCLNTLPNLYTQVDQIYGNMYKNTQFMVNISLII